MTRATQGEILIFGHHLRPGAEVLTRLGALVEGPGFLPHVSGLENLRLFWRSTGRPDAEARLDEALEIAGLGDAIHRKVRKYSHGMKQRLAIAQAMLGLPELLVLDEPTDGLDPPQIAEMRKVLRAYATDGRAVLVSSHLLAEVEQTCTHVVVMHKGVVVADGPVDDIVGDSPIAQFDVSDVDAATSVLAGLAGVRSVAADGGRAGRRPRRHGPHRSGGRARPGRRRRGPGGPAPAAGGRVPDPGRWRNPRKWRAMTTTIQSPAPDPGGDDLLGRDRAAPAGQPAPHPDRAGRHGGAASDHPGRVRVRRRRR